MYFSFMRKKRYQKKAEQKNISGCGEISKNGGVLRNKTVGRLLHHRRIWDAIGLY